MNVHNEHINAIPYISPYLRQPLRTMEEAMQSREASRSEGRKFYGDGFGKECWTW